MQRVRYIMIGNTDVGKTSIVRKYMNDRPAIEPTIGVDFEAKYLKYMDQEIKITVWDATGEKKFRHIISSYYDQADIILLVFDVTNPSSFEDLEIWLSDLKQKTTNPNIILIGNKIDLTTRRVISFDRATEYAKKNNMSYIETSALTNQGIDKIFPIHDRPLSENKGGILNVASFIYGESNTSPRSCESCYPVNWCYIF